MKKHLLLLSVFFLFLIPITSFSVNPYSQVSDYEKKNNDHPIIDNFNAQNIREFSVNEIEDKLGRKLNFKEKVALKFVKKKLKKNKDLSLSEAYNEARFHALAIAGFITGLVGLIIFGIPLGILSVIFGAVALSKISRSEGQLLGKGFAIAALILGFVDIIGALIVISLLA